MFDPVIEVLVLAAVALIVLSRLYMALGRGGDDRPVQRPTPSQAPLDSAPTDLAARRQRRDHAERPIFTGPAAGGLEEIYFSCGVHAGRESGLPDDCCRLCAG